ncbi:hypothetical protein [Shimia biformata]|uniref:hypothetical protein n=1 Tax=Shimia biformata TaxID=1294299 RepID=UPI00194E4E77|nr:hypothetical protein [Shimia biformata]
MSRSYKDVHLKKHYVYSVDELMAECDVVRNTVSNWRRDGLRASDDNHPLMFNGAEVIRFHKKRRARTNSPLRVGQFKCVACKGRVFPDIESVQIDQSSSGSCLAFGQCPDCGTRVRKRLTATNCDKIKVCIDTNTSLDSLDEEIEETPVSIVNDGHCENETFSKPNDRIIHAWLARAGCWDVKTTDAKNATIRTFETFCHEKCFSKLNVSDVGGFREELKRSVDPASQHLHRPPQGIPLARFSFLVDQSGWVQGVEQIFV